MQQQQRSWGSAVTQSSRRRTTTTPLLVCEEGSLRSQKRRRLTGTFKWKSRCFVLLDNSTLLFYEDSTRSSQPSLSLKIDHNVGIGVTDGHPTHIEITCQRLDGLSSCEGSDVPPQGRTLELEDNELHWSWRIRFPSEGAAATWKDALDDLRRNAPIPPRTHGVDASISRHDDTAAAWDISISRHGDDTAAWDNMRWTRIMILFAMLPITFLSRIAWTKLWIYSDAVSIHVAEWLDGMKGTIGQTLKYSFDQSSDLTDEAMKDYTLEQSAERLEPVFIGGSSDIVLITEWLETMQYAVWKTVKYTLDQSSEQPEPVQTYLRDILSLLKESFQSSGVFPPGSFVHENLLVCSLALTVSFISLLSVASKVVHWRLLLAASLTVISILLSQDTFENHFRHPLRYGLYWNGYVQGGAGLVGIFLACQQVRRASGWQPRTSVSNRRKVASALGALVCSLSLPLMLRGMIDSDQQSPFVFTSFAFLAAFVGMHFFGWARRDIVVGGFPFGEIVYQISLAPLKAGQRVLREAEIYGGFVVRRCSLLLEHFSLRFAGPIFCWLDRVLERICRSLLRVERVMDRLVDRLIKGLTMAIGFFAQLLTSFFTPAYILTHWMQVVVFPRLLEVTIFLRAKLLSIDFGVFDFVQVCVSMTEELLNVVLIQPLLQASSFCLAVITKVTNFAWTLVQNCFSQVIILMESASIRIWRSLLNPFLRGLLYSFDVVFGVVISIVSPFLKKYWQLASAALALNGSYCYVCTAIISNVATIDRVKYLLGGWSLAVIGLVLGRSVFLSRGLLTNQHVTVEESPLRFMDLGLFYALSEILPSGWHLLSKSFEILLQGVDAVVRKTCSALWCILGMSYQLLLEPVLRFLLIFWEHTWNSPVLSILAAAGLVLIAYCAHANQISLFCPSTFLDYAPLVSIVTATQKWCVLLSDRISVGTGFVYILLSDVCAPFVNTTASSPNVALYCWLFASVLSKGQRRVRIKTFAVPVVVFYLAGMTNVSLMKPTTSSLFLWVLLALLVDRYEKHSRERARAAFERFKPQGIRAKCKHRHLDEGLECVICLDAMADGHQVLLPCGHQFHRHCIDEWLKSSSAQRCPICRRATGGWDRILEVVF